MPRGRHDVRPSPASDCGYEPAGRRTGRCGRSTSRTTRAGLPGQFSLHSGVHLGRPTPAVGTFTRFKRDGYEGRRHGAASGCAAAVCDGLPTNPGASRGTSARLTRYLVYIGQDNKFTTSVLAPKSVPSNDQHHAQSEVRRLRRSARTSDITAGQLGGSGLPLVRPGLPHRERLWPRPDLVSDHARHQVVPQGLSAGDRPELVEPRLAPRSRSPGTSTTRATWPRRGSARRQPVGEDLPHPGRQRAVVSRLRCWTTRSSTRRRTRPSTGSTPRARSTGGCRRLDEEDNG